MSRRCFRQNYKQVRGFDLPSLAGHVAHAAGLPPVIEIHFFIGTLDPARDSEANYWRIKLKRMAEAGVEVHKRRVKYRPRFTCASCSSTRASCMHCPSVTEGEKAVEKGIDTELAVSALGASYRQPGGTFLFFAQDSDHAPAVKAMRAQTLDPNQGRFVSAVPLCDSDHQHSGIPGTRLVHFDSQALSRSRSLTVLRS